MRVFPEIRVNRAVVETAERNGVGLYAPVERAIAHEVNRGLKHKEAQRIRAGGETETNFLFAAGFSAAKRRAAQVIGAPLGGKYGLSGLVPADEDAVVVLRVLI